MSLYGALFSGVSGLASESSAMGAIADNISNVNTIGYKGTDVNFNTLVTNQVSLTQYSPGGVQSAPRAAIDIQGLLQATSSSTDMALSGQGFFIVNALAQPTATSGEFAYTRAGSFIPNQNGYLVNSAGYYLQGWPLEPTDNTLAAKPVETTINGTVYMTAYKNAAGNTVYVNQNVVNNTSLQPLNLNTIGGSAQATTNISLGANLPSGDPIFSPNNTVAGGQYNSSVLTYDSLGDSTNSLFTWTKLAANQWSLGVQPPQGAAVATVYNNTSQISGPTVYAAQGQLEFDSIPPAGSYFSINGVRVQFYDSTGVPPTANPTADTPVAGPPAVPSTLGVDLTGVTTTTDLTTRLVQTLQQAANVPYGSATYTPPNGPTPTISAALLGGLADGASRFMAVGATMQMQQFPGGLSIDVNAASNTTTMLGNSIVESGANTGSIGGNIGQFTVPAIYGTAGTTTTNGSPLVTGGPSTYVDPATGSNSFTISAALAGGVPTGYFQIGNQAVLWADIYNQVSPITTYTVTNPPVVGPPTTYPPVYTANATPVTVTYNDPSGNPLPASSDQLSLAENFQAALPQLFSGYTVSNISGTAGANAATLTLQAAGTTGVTGFTGDAGPVIADAADPLNAINTAGEITWADTSDGGFGELMGPSGSNAYAADAVGLTFNGDGTPALGTTTNPGIIPSSMGIIWANGSENQVEGSNPANAEQPDIALNLGSANETNGMTQLGGSYTVSFLQQNGAKFGNFSGVSIGGNGVVTALFDNGVRTPVFQIPVATFPNPDGMQSLTGNVYIDTTSSGAYTVRQAGTGGSGTVAEASLEASTVDLGTQFTTMITVQRAYSAAAKVITTTDTMLSDLLQMVPQ